MRKGITPIIAIIVLLLITVALAGAAWTYLSTYMSGLTGQSVEVRDYFCINSDTAVIMIANTGTLDIEASEISIINMSSGSPMLSDGASGHGNWTTANGCYLPGASAGAADDGSIEVGKLAKWTSPSGVCTTTESCVFRVVGGTARAQVARVLC
jgi:flagellin-like protein